MSKVKGQLSSLFSSPYLFSQRLYSLKISSYTKGGPSAEPSINTGRQKYTWKLRRFSPEDPGINVQPPSKDNESQVSH